MHSPLQTLSATAAILGLASAAPALPRAFGDPTDDGFPSPSAAQLAAIETMADGQLSNAPPPATLAQSSLTAFQLIAFNENFEVAFFSSLIDNITADMDGYRLAPKAKDDILSVLKTVKAVSPIPLETRVSLPPPFTSPPRIPPPPKKRKNKREHQTD